MFLIYDSTKNYNNEQYLSIFSSLPLSDKEKIRKINRINDKKLTILSRYLLINLLKKHYNIDYNCIKIYYNEFQKPFIKNIYFNISHSHDYSIVVSSTKKIGVDIEKIRKVDLSIINFFCTEDEKNFILESSNPYKSLFSIFCLKEAYIKMLGKGISYIKNVEFKILDEKIVCKNNSNLNICLIYDITNYVVAIIEDIS